jgi:hypothetical protein
MLIGTRLAHSAYAPSPLITPTLTLPGRGGGDLVGPPHKIGAEQCCGRGWGEDSWRVANSTRPCFPTTGRRDVIYCIIAS